MSKSVFIVEKNDAAETIASRLGSYQTVEEKKANIKYYKVGSDIFVPARGHLMKIDIKFKRKGSLDSLPVNEYNWVVSRGEKDRIDFIKKLINEADRAVVATDWDREGEVIGYNIYKYALGDSNPKKIDRMYYSSLSASEIRDSYNNIKKMSPSLLSQGLARNISDAVIGLNLTKGLTMRFREIYKNLGQSISIGRVQSPLLSHIQEIVVAKINYDGVPNEVIDNTNVEYFIKFSDDFMLPVKISAPEIEFVGYYDDQAEIKQAEPLLSTDDVMQQFPLPPKDIMDVLENIYLKGWTTYPRTTSRYVRNISSLTALRKEIKNIPETFSEENTPKYRVESAHPDAIIPTVEGIQAYYSGKITGRERFMFEFILSSIIRSFAPKLIVNRKIARFVANGEEHDFVWKEDIVNNGDVTKYRELVSYPDIETGKYPIVQIKTIQSKTKLYPRFDIDMSVPSETDVVGWMSRFGLGTEATRQSFVPLLEERHYISNMIPSQLGEIVSKIINEIGLTPELTAKIENDISSLKTLDDLPAFEETIKEDTSQFIEKLKTVDVPRMKCPKCGSDSELITLFLKNQGQNLLMISCPVCKKLYNIG